MKLHWRTKLWLKLSFGLTMIIVSLLVDAGWPCVLGLVVLLFL